ncbi:hypothetical protein E4K67_28245 [Desulfosporosinus fructosivorans]|uniref:Uncharacterized protein n=1 Tax=Desulfosporosinus fructosivorans TaxID=2018669 RepID=A0A4Z0QWL7_9FIRM|nr:hypothetical protein [Desulfosporosinus fructosivorans]TGE34898.1 hypothetical protein E4K67_28245 [Desulfosporosinus fructosivorans]
MMSINLSELGRVLCREFDQREHELKTLHSEIRTKVKKDRAELYKLSDVDRNNQMKAQEQIVGDASGLLDKYRVERATLVKVLKGNEVSQIGEMNTWAREREEDLKGWYKAGRYILGKPEESKGEHENGGYILRKRIGR